jgi:hypothetical protein
VDISERKLAAFVDAAERSWDDLADATIRVGGLLWGGISSRGDPLGVPSHPRGRWGRHRRQEASVRALMSLIQNGVTKGDRTCLMIWCMLAADAIRRFDGLGEGSWILRDVRLGGVPSRYLATLIETSRLLKGSSFDRVEVAYLLAQFVTAAPLLVETVTLLLAAAPPPASPGKPYVLTTSMIEAVGHLGVLTHNQLIEAHKLAVTWRDGPAALAVEARIRSAGVR